MRIRKHAKISSLLLSTSSLSSSSNTLLKSHLICQLNQSPWDVITFPPPSDSSPPAPPFQFDGDHSFNGNGSVADSIGAVESVGSMKLALEKMDHENAEEREEKQVGANLCCKTDGKQWQCRREAQKRHTMCEHHLDQIRNYNSLAHPPINKASNKPTRARKSTSAAPSNPNEFYYYSGFGPRWGKKRDSGASITHKREREVVEPVRVTVPVTSYSDDEIDDDEDEDEDEKEENCGSGKKRRRKRVKARSLKDLCEGMG